MNAYATTSKVQDQGQVHVAGVPFAPGTEVEVTISPKLPSNAPVLTDSTDWTAARDRLRELFGIVKGFRNSPRIPREELYERGSFR